MHRDRFYTLSASCPDQVGIIAKVSGLPSVGCHTDTKVGSHWNRMSG